MTMKAKLTPDAHKALDEGLQKEYVEKDGAFVLDVEAVDGLTLDDVGGLKSALQKERENVAERDRQLKAVEGLDPAKAREALAKVEEMSTWTPEEKVAEQIAQREKQLVEKHTKELGDKDAELTDLTTQLEAHLIDAAATGALTELKGNVALLLPHVRSQTKVVRQDGKFVARVVDQDGTVRVSMKQGSTDPMGVVELVEEMKGKDTFQGAFAGQSASGGGGKGSDSGGRGGSAHRITFADSKDVGKYRSAKAAADEAGVTLEVEAPIPNIGGGG